MKKVYIHAYLAGNLGDDLFIRILCERYPHVKFYLLADEIYKLRYWDLPNCMVSSCMDRRVLLIDRFLKRLGIQDGFRKLLIRFSDAVIHIGGCCFTQHYDDWSPLYECDYNLVHKSRRLYLIGANFGPYVDERYHKVYEELFGQYDGICFRDSYSKSLFQNLPKVSWAPDVIFQYKSCPLEEKKKKVVVAPIELAHRDGKYSICEYEKDYLDFHVKIIRYLIRRGYQISILSFCQSQMDDSMIQKICDRLNDDEKKEICCMAYQAEAAPVIREFEEAEAVIGTRFHSMILGLANRCKVLPIIYDQKTRKVLEDLKYPLRAELKDLETWNADLAAEELLAAKPPDPSIWKRDSAKQFQYTDRFFL